ncbi:MAG: MBL fold metallo-hydrolase [Massilibacteroides sp.]|nr:MBL fold metallo-hydrolase [Massilibacteroides sp.]MDD3063439.1 MBL fold metallo-hydrolase [Massilibacteroides sp.]MDD4114471.1 MBL fold metallo-hydrolase [Massilibacteroides sp.]MDD4660954.1 MBL fold metallo-hydrolase [Massilibacteroides sp.]
MKITFLGTGTSTGVPEIGCQCEVCKSPDKRDKRLRSSLLIETEGKNILIDCGPDFRWQMIKNKVSYLDAVLITHEHYDHIGGLDDLRPFSRDRNLDVFAEKNVLEAIQAKMPYIFHTEWKPALPHFSLHRVDLTPFEAVDVPVIPIRVMHGPLPILGFRIGDMAYLTDIKELPEEEFDKLKGVEILIIEALRKSKHPTHETLHEALKNIEKIAPKYAYLTHMSHQIGLHAVTEKELPPSVFLAWDGLSIG